MDANRFATELKEAYDIIVPTVETPVRLLSGGNLQRVILAREISGQPALMVAVQPTRGLDVGAIEGVHRLLLEQREAGAAILLISEELEELLSLSDRVLVIYEGQIMGELSGRRPAGQLRTIGLMMTGTPLERNSQEQSAHGRIDESPARSGNVGCPSASRLEPRLAQPPRWYPVCISFGAIVVALIIGGIVIALAGGNPFASYAHIARASFGSLGVFSDTLVKATPLILVGLACSVAFRMKLWNIGAEGQFFMGAFGASAVVLTPAAARRRLAAGCSSR